MIWFILTALAAPPTDLADAWYDVEQSRYAEAAAVAKSVLHDDPQDLDAHRLYIAARHGLGEAEPVAAFYRGWWEEDEDSVVRRVAFAEALVRANDRPGRWCGELDRLLVHLPSDPDARYMALRARYTAHQRCPGDPSDDLGLLLALEDDGSLAYRTYLRMMQGQFDADLASDLETVYQKWPWKAKIAGLLWQVEGQGVERARDKALEVAETLAASNDPKDVRAAWVIYREAGEIEAQMEADDRWRSLDPPEGRDMVSDPFRMQLQAAQLKPTPEKALKALDKLEPPDDYVASWQIARFTQLTKLERYEEGFEAVKAAYAAEKTAETRNIYAYFAAQFGEELDEALVAVDAAIEEVGQRDYPLRYARHLPFERWSEQHALSMANMHDTRGWVLYKLGRHEEAAGALKTALSLSRDGIFHAHLGLVYLELGEDELAFRHLAWGLGVGISEDRLREEVEETYRGMFVERAYFGDAEDWVAAIHRAEDGEVSTGSDTLDHPLIGEPFPVETFSMGGKDRSRDDLDGVWVVDLWATWCEPCIRSMPHVADLSDRYEVNLLALSVDRTETEVKRFFKGEKPKMDVAWVGPRAMQEVRIAGIPAQFVLRDGEIIGFVSGWTGPTDGRLEDALRRAVRE